MVSRSDITDSEWAFLASQKILVSHLYDARGRAATSWGDDARAAGKLFGLSEPCIRGHRLRNRSGHCIQCDTSRIAYIRRNSSPGIVYVAVSKSAKLIKIGSCADIDQRLRNLKYQEYAGTSDWEAIAWSKSPAIGKIEFEIHSQLSDIAVERKYLKDGRTQISREVFQYDVVRVWQVYKQAVSKIDEKLKWKHPQLLQFKD